MRRWVRAVEEIAGHLIVVIALLFSFRIVEWVFDFLWGSNALLFDLVPFKWLIQGADVAMFLAFVYAGGRSALRAYQGD
jgi:hypothetical protein